MKKIILNGTVVDLTPELEAQLYPPVDSPDLSYIEDRRKEYPPLAEQLDMMYHDKVNGTNHWFDLIESIKLKYPKPEEVPSE